MKFKSKHELSLKVVVVTLFLFLGYGIFDYFHWTQRELIDEISDYAGDKTLSYSWRRSQWSQWLIDNVSRNLSRYLPIKKEQVCFSLYEDREGILDPVKDLFPKLTVINHLKIHCKSWDYAKKIIDNNCKLKVITVDKFYHSIPKVLNYLSKKCPELEIVNLFSYPDKRKLTLNECKYLGHFKKLREVYGESKITKEALRYLISLPNIEEISFLNSDQLIYEIMEESGVEKYPHITIDFRKVKYTTDFLTEYIKTRIKFGFIELKGSDLTEELVDALLSVQLNKEDYSRVYITGDIDENLTTKLLKAELTFSLGFETEKIKKWKKLSTHSD